ncbi:MAG: hypothetical protein ACXU9X_12730 [Thermodesulfobacteriota bacterium]
MAHLIRSERWKLLLAFQRKDGRLLDIGLKDFDRPQHVFTPQCLFLLFRQDRISHDTSNALPLQYPVHAYHLGDIRDGGDLDNRNTDLFNSGCDRCTATSARASG